VIDRQPIVGKEETAATYDEMIQAYIEMRKACDESQGMEMYANTLRANLISVTERYNELIGSREPDRLMDEDVLLDRDPHMKVVIGIVKEREPITQKIKEVEKKDPMRIEAAKKELEKLRSEGKDAVITDIYEMRAKDAAFYDPLCARCEPACPVDLPVTKYIRDVKADEKYR